MSVPKTGEALREEIKATLRAAHERCVDLDALTDNVEIKLKERDALLSNGGQCERPHQTVSEGAFFALALLIGIIGFCAGGLAVSTTDHHETHAAQPYHQAYFATLRADAERICAQGDANYNSGNPAAGYKAWLALVDRYIADQTNLERSRHTVAPNYQDMGNVVCPAN